MSVQLSPASPAPTALALQRMVGNRAVARRLDALPAQQARGTTSIVVQRESLKLLAKKPPSRQVQRLLRMSTETALDQVAVMSDLREVERAVTALEKAEIDPSAIWDPADPFGPFRMIDRLVRLKIALADRQEVLALSKQIAKLAKSKGRGLTPADAKWLQARLAALQPAILKDIEKEIGIWKSWIPSEKKREILDFVTGPLRLSDLEESQRARFATADGDEIKKAIVELGSGMATDRQQCLNFVYAATGLLIHDEAALATARARYRLGVRERTSGLHQGGTLARLAGELRLQGTLGPVRPLPWTGTKATGRHQGPSPSKVTPEKLFTALSGAGPGWYFFMLSQFGHHTRLVAVEKTAARRRFYLMEHLADGTIEEEITGSVNEAFDDFNRPDAKAPLGSKVWPVYVKPQPR